ncbi:hypothetical protein T265_00341 [Opisthorchis viverrini]|uniref:Uncharacterized protein n=1 Tax=Opisthorchis viverrini TaxID=6198 RepID=A0A075A2E7_OPIVI|nr:hypothetical protein T265_00341 [Opisthorchis viverrini]KER33898.1 hypothetical protein T265_00341 [Opisthorchis viverrini]
MSQVRDSVEVETAKLKLKAPTDEQYRFCFQGRKKKTASSESHDVRFILHDLIFCPEEGSCYDDFAGSPIPQKRCCISNPGQ